MNRLADAVVGLALAAGLAIPGTVRTPDVVPAARLARLDALGLTALHGGAAGVALLVSIAVAVLAALWRTRSRAGRETVLVGLSPSACAAERIPVARRLAVAMVASGAIAASARWRRSSAPKGTSRAGWGRGLASEASPWRCSARGHPVGLLLAALLFGTLEQGGLVINAWVPMEVMTVLQGLVIVAVALADARVRAAALGWRP